MYRRAHRYPVVIVAALWGSLSCASALRVSVDIDGPTEGWVKDVLAYAASGSYTLDAETQQEVRDGEATVSTSYMWSYGPAQLVSENSCAPFIAIRYPYVDGAAYHAMAVTYTVTVKYSDGSSDTGSDTASLQVKVKRVELSVGSDKTSICAGAVASAPHQATITATVTDGFQPLSGRGVSFFADHEYNRCGPSCIPPTSTTDASGMAHSTLTSGDGAVTGEVRATCDEVVALTPVAFDEPGKTVSFEDPSTGEPTLWLYPDGESQCKVVLSLRYGGVPISGHAISWTWKFWDAEADPSVDPPVYEGTVQAPYGSIWPTGGQSDGSGLAHTIYTVGTAGGSIEFRAIDGNVYTKELGSQSPAARVAATSGWKATSKQRGLGEEGGDIAVKIVGAWWMTAGYADYEKWQSHIRVSGEPLYPMVKLKPLVEHGTVPATTPVRIWSGATDQSGFVMHLAKASGPDGDGVCKYWPTAVSQPSVGVVTSPEQHVIGVGHPNDGVNEYTTHDNHDPTDSNAIRFGHVRGYGREYEDAASCTLRADLEYLRCAGIERICVGSLVDVSKTHAIAAKNQADLLYFSGHGSADTGNIWREPQLPTPVNYSDIGMQNWTNDLDVFVIAACSVLNIPEMTEHGNNVGLGWVDNCVRYGPLQALCGYHDSAPADTGGIPQQIAAGFSDRFSGDNGPAAWRDANNAVANTWWCASDKVRYYWHSQHFLGRWVDHEKAY